MSKNETAAEKLRKVIDAMPKRDLDAELAEAREHYECVRKEAEIDRMRRAAQWLEFARRGV